MGQYLYVDNLYIYSQRPPLRECIVKKVLGTQQRAEVLHVQHGNACGCTLYLGADEIQTLNQSIPTLNQSIQPGLQFAGHLLVLDTAEQVLTHGAQLVHGGALHIQLCLDNLVEHKQNK